MMTEAEREMEKMFFPQKIEYMRLFGEKEYDKAWELCLNTVDMFPEPRYEQPLMYLWVEDVVKYSIETKQYEIGNKYAPLLMITGLLRIDDGARELLMGKLAYEQGNFLVAKQFLLMSYNKNPGKIFFKRKENQKYLKFMKENS